MAINFDKDKLEESRQGNITTVSYNDKGAFMEGCEVSKKDVIEVFKHSNNYIVDATDFAAGLATEKFKEDKDLERVLIDFPYGPTGSGEVAIAIDREKTFRIPGSNDTLTRPNIGVKVSHNQLKVGKSHIKSLQEDMLNALK